MNEDPQIPQDAEPASARQPAAIEAAEGAAPQAAGLTRPLYLINLTDHVVTDAWVRGAHRKTNAVGRTCSRKTVIDCLCNRDYKELFQLECGDDEVQVIMGWREGDGYVWRYSLPFTPRCSDPLGWTVYIEK
jgi:hypothetical protein